MAKKTIVTHVNPDLDAITSIWLLVRFGGDDFINSTFKFVAAGERLEKEDSNVVHVDTGKGKFDHHQESRGKERTCAAKLVYEWLIFEKKIEQKGELESLLSIVTEIDHFGEYFWPEPGEDRYQLFLAEVLNGVKLGGFVKNDTELVKFGMVCLDGVLVNFKIGDSAEKALTEGISFTTKWGKTLAVETSNHSVIKLGLKMGFKVVAVRDPESGRVRIKSAPLDEINLKEVYEKLVKIDGQASWYFHPGGHMILNGSSKNPKMRPSKLAIDEMISVLKSV